MIYFSKLDIPRVGIRKRIKKKKKREIKRLRNKKKEREKKKGLLWR